MKINTYMKAITLLVILHGMILVTMSYVLAWFDRPMVENVSITLVTEIVAPIIVYGCTNMIMNIFEKNHLSFSTPLAFIKGCEEETHIVSDDEE